MTSLFTSLCLLAEEAAPPEQPNILMWMIPALLIFFLFQMFFASSPQRREQKHIDQLKASLKKNDPVVTAGGIIGTVANVSPDKNEVTIKVDDNTRIRVRMASVYPQAKEETKDQKPEPPPPLETK